jgi:MFS family permease
MIIYVPFRAPNGDPYWTFDHFLLPRTFPLMLVVVALGFAFGIFTMSSLNSNYYYMEFVFMAILCGLTFGICACIPSLLQLFIKLSDHCQRATGYISALLSWHIGLLCGVAGFIPLSRRIHFCDVNAVACVAVIIALVFFQLLAYPYYKKKKLR